MLIKKLVVFCLLLFSIPCFSYKNKIQKAVTYELSPGRFGDNLLSYIHAKWISYHHRIPLLYKPFIYSNQLLLHKLEYFYTDEIKKSFKKNLSLEACKTIYPGNDSILYLVPYFPESKWELKNCISFSGGSWYHFYVDWSDKGFINELRRVIAPIKTMPEIILPKDRISVAVHSRKGGNHDTPVTLLGFPLKFLTDDFFINQIREIYLFFNKYPLYVYLFTDDNNPVAIIDKFKNNLIECDIEFDCRRYGNSDTTNVIEDFFALQQFDCLIHSESNFSFIPAKIFNYMISIYPDSFHKVNNQIIYDNINFTVNYNHPKFANIDQKR